MSKILVPESAQSIPEDYSGHIFISDIDKTYLATQIDSLGGLLRAALETPVRKKNVPGFSIILRAVRRGGRAEAEKNPLFFISASPPQMRKKILSKMELDGIDHDGIIFKNQLENVKAANFKKLREQIGYKLLALLNLWCALPKKSKLVLFGDDSESDAATYTLFAHILGKNLKDAELIRLLRNMGVFREDAVTIAWISRKLKGRSYPVQAVMINLETGAQPSYFTRFGNFIYATENSLQTALALHEQGLIREQAVKSVAKDMMIHHDFTAEQLIAGLESAARRGLFSLETLDKIWAYLHEMGLFPAPIKRDQFEGAVSTIASGRWGTENLKTSLSELRRRYLDQDF